MLGSYLMLGVWPIIMGITMWIQMKLNPTPPDPTQKMIFDWMPLIFTFMLAGFPAGLVIYWAWNNLLSVLQQSYIMRKNGVKVELFDNLKATFAKKPAVEKTVNDARHCERASRHARRVPSIHVFDVAASWIAVDAPRTSPAMTIELESPSHDRRTRCEADRAGPQAVRRRLAVHLGLALDRNAAADGGASRSRLPAAPMSANPA